ncbi:hypothetical protein FAUST_3107 [Fusarium austroamericanum]|uniref:H-type lectin domain-containing protein n=1 Tax=Fusarium austroamericanum TaxID=282268 RepID=A0AAN6HHZ6_FUSAU|nr:hypothetical protein FAUST_3107 [Fusarium austroamericanum]
MSSPPSQPPQGATSAHPSEDFDHVSVGSHDYLPSEYLANDSTEGWDTPSSSDFTPTKQFQFRPNLTVNVYNTGGGGSSSGASDASTINAQRSTERDEVLTKLKSQLAALSRRVDELSQEQEPSPAVIDSGTWSTITVRSWENPQVHTEGRVSFSKDFKTAPTVSVSISAADVSKDANFRVKVYATAVDATGFTAHADSWSNTKIYSCEISWIAIGS